MEQPPIRGRFEIVASHRRAADLSCRIRRLILAAIALGCERTAAVDEHVRLAEAAGLIEYGELDRAQAELDAQGDLDALPRAKFLRAIIAYARGDRDASERIEELPSDPARDVLLQMARLGGAQRGSDRALVRAWRTSGEPDLRSSRLLPPKEPDPIRPLPRPLASAPAGRRFLLMLADEDDLSPEKATAYSVFSLDLIRLAHEIAADRREDLELRLIAASVLADASAGDPTPVLEDGAAAEPYNLYFRLAAAAAGAPPVVLKEADLRRLESMASLPRFDWHFAEIYEKCRSILADLGPIDSRVRAFDAAVGSRRPEIFHLNVVLEARVPAEMEERRCDAVRGIARRIARASSLLDRGFGSALLVSTAERCGGEEAAKLRKAKVSRVIELVGRHGRAAVPRWPLPIAAEELDAIAKAEYSYFAAMAE